MVTEKQLKNLELGRFSSTKQPINRVKRGASPLTFIKKYITRQITCADPISHEQKKMAIGEVIGLQWLSKAYRGDPEAIKDILDRIDGCANNKNGNGGPVAVIINIRNQSELLNSQEQDAIRQNKIQQ